ncbi:hypothetical protein [Methanoregula sp.]|uniref:hypothetical protein n=1 Tax=Methanoregula sp. TaxID=2052170 RepID=UPI002374D79E|nr:hypothetical protein [Methanoregula sp.]MDD1687038.1 hypothetical protein [Methanoregula sp.]
MNTTAEKKDANLLRQRERANKNEKTPIRNISRIHNQPKRRLEFTAMNGQTKGQNNWAWGFPMNGVPEKVYGFQSGMLPVFWTVAPKNER